MWSIALKTLIADRGKLLTALVGVIFSIVLVNVQGGLFLGLIRKASLLVDYSGAEIWVGHHQMNNVDFAKDIPRRWEHRIRALPGVERAEPYLIGHSTMTLPSGGFEPVLLVGSDRATLLGNAWSMAEGSPADILQADGVIVDTFDDVKLDNPQVGELREIGGRRARIVAKSHGILGFLVTPYVFTTLPNAANYLHKDLDSCSYFLVKVAPGYDPAEVCQSIKARLPTVEAYTREEYSQMSIDYWMKRTGLGISFGAATLLGLFVGLVIVAQTLYASVLDRIGEFGTLLAIGAKQWQIYSLLLAQAVMMATGGAIIGLAIVHVVQYLFSTPLAMILIPWWVSLGSCVTVYVICIVSSLLPYLRIRKIDPAMVLQS